MKRLFVQVIVLAGVIIGLSRLAGRQASPPDDALPPGQAPGQYSDGPARMSSAPPDLTFYRTLGDAQSAPARPDLSHRSDPDNNDAKGGGLRYAQEVPDDRTGAYVVQALSTRDGAAARRLRDRLAARGFPATAVSEDKTAGRPVYRVRAGRYNTRAEAETAVRVLRQKHHLSPWILQEGK